MTASTSQYLIIGQGLAGTFLSMRFQQMGISHQLIDEPAYSQSSRIAAGIINPIVLKRLKWVKGAEQFLPSLSSFYREWEQELKQRFYHPLSMNSVLHKSGDANDWMERSAHPPFQEFLGPVFHNPPANIHAPHGYGQVTNLAWCNTAKLLSSYRHKLQQQGLLSEHAITAREVAQIRSENPHQSIILANGHLAPQLQPKLKDYFRPTRGEVMTIEAPKLDADQAWHGGVFILPLGNHQFKVGATYHHDILADKTSSEGLAKLRQGLEKIFSGNYKVLAHEAGVRPNTRDRQPLLGAIDKGLYLFDGLGSRGTLMGPHLAEVMAQHITRGRALPQAWDVQRFISN